METKKRLEESKLFTPYKLGSVTLRNRVIRSAAFESMGKDFAPTQALKDYHVSVAKGGVGMTTVAYASINRSGISFNKQLWLRDEIVPALRDLTDAVHAEGAAVGIQLGHCGNMTHWSTAGSFPVSASNGFNLYSPTFHRRMRKSEIVEFANDFGKAVDTAHEAGFDSVEVHAGHGYLISQFLSPYTNHRRDEYGGSLENRMRFMNMCLEEVVNTARKRGMGVLVKHNMEDGFKSGMQIPESIEIAKQIEQSCGIKHARIIGAADKPTKRVAMCLGACGDMVFDLLRNTDCETVIAGEICEWREGCFVRDAAQLGFNKSVILLGHCGSERDGMKYLTDIWNTICPEVPGKYFETGELYTYTEGDE